MQESLTHLSATALSARLQSGALRAADLMAATLARIAAVNPGLNAIIAVRPATELMAEAEAVDRARAAGAALGPFAGLPFAVKDVKIYDPLPQHAERKKAIRSQLSQPPEEPGVLWEARLRAAGAICIGKTNIVPWGEAYELRNPAYGTARNPYDLACGAGGWPGGAAAAVAARLVALADGSDMMSTFSITAAFCNIYGFRPSFGLVHDDPRGELLYDTLCPAGLMARSPADLALILDLLRGPTPRGAPFAPLAPRPLKGVKIGWLADWGGAYLTEPSILSLCAAALQVMKRAGARVRTLRSPFRAAKISWAWQLAENSLIAGRPLCPPDMCETVDTPLAIEYPRLFEILKDLNEESEIRSRWYHRAMKLFDDFDLLALPSAQAWPFPLEMSGPFKINGRRPYDNNSWMEVTMPAAMAGLPTLALPIGFGPEGGPGAGFPMGLQLIGPPGSDAALLAYGAAYHDMTDWPGQNPPRLAGVSAAG